MVLGEFQQSLDDIMLQINVAIPDSKNQLNKINRFLAPTETSTFSDVLTRHFQVIKPIYAILETNLKSNRGNEAEYNKIVGLAEQLIKLYEDYEKSWNSMDLKKAMKFMHDNKGVFQMTNGSNANIFPSKTFTLPVNKDNAIKAGIIQPSDSCPTSIVLNYSSEKYISREEIMMLDIMANFDWKRGIYFSSNRGSKLAQRLLSQGSLKQIGRAYELNPSIPLNVINLNKNYQEQLRLEKQINALLDDTASLIDDDFKNANLKPSCE